MLHAHTKLLALLLYRVCILNAVYKVKKLVEKLYLWSTAQW